MASCRSHNMEGKLCMVKVRMLFLDTKGETSALVEEAVAELHDLSVNLHSLLRVQTNMCWQQERMNWLKEDDANSKKNHGVMSSNPRLPFSPFWELYFTFYAFLPKWDKKINYNFFNIWKCPRSCNIFT